MYVTEEDSVYVTEEDSVYVTEEDSVYVTWRRQCVCDVEKTVCM